MHERRLNTNKISVYVRLQAVLCEECLLSGETKYVMII